MTNINDIASVHLGKAGDGTVVKPYVTPDSIDPSLLVGIPRVLNRKQYKIDSDRKSTRLNSSHVSESRMPSSA